MNGTNYYQNVNWPSLHWAGWYDIFQRGNLEAYWGFQHRSNASAGVRGHAKLVVDPLGHCQSAERFFTHNTTFGRILLPFLMAFSFMADDRWVLTARCSVLFSSACLTLVALE